MRKLEAFRNYKGFSVVFPKSLDAIERFTNGGKFPYSSLHNIF